MYPDSMELGHGQSALQKSALEENSSMKTVRSPQEDAFHTPDPKRPKARETWQAVRQQLQASLSDKAEQRSEAVRSLKVVFEGLDTMRDEDGTLWTDAAEVRNHDNASVTDSPSPGGRSVATNWVEEDPDGVAAQRHESARRAAAAREHIAATQGLGVPDSPVKGPVDESGVPVAVPPNRAVAPLSHDR